MFFLNTEICHVHHHLINKAKVEVSRTENNSGFYLNVTFQDKLFFKTNKLLSLTHPIKCYCIVRSPTLQIVIISLTSMVQSTFQYALGPVRLYMYFTHKVFSDEECALALSYALSQRLRSWQIFSYV